MYDMNVRELDSFIAQQENAAAKLNHERPGTPEHRFEAGILKDAKELRKQKRACIHEGCDGTQTFSPNMAPPGSQAGVGTGSGAVAWGSASNRGPAWRCDKNSEHFDREP